MQTAAFRASARVRSPGLALLLGRACRPDGAGACGVGSCGRALGAARRVDRLATRLAAHRGFRGVAVQSYLAFEIGGDDQVRLVNLVALGVEDEEVGLADLPADHEDHARRLDGDVGDVGIGDHDEARVRVETHEMGLVDDDAERLGAFGLGLRDVLRLRFASRRRFRLLTNAENSGGWFIRSFLPGFSQRSATANFGLP